MKVNPKTIVSIVADQAGCQEESIRESWHFINELNLDSLDHLEIIMAVESQYNIDIPDSEAEHLTSVDKIVAYLGAL